eukprot:TRINITY_DN9325_c1_g1_i1.p1 TRINITY_DN9325_c1_g1~~TRINITY_DN9325_c1_g1_i1.p1  ORF type:complete len:238 (+),score=37.32 TRINITY_DN9325_c1_g1_i1:81-716(+)
MALYRQSSLILAVINVIGLSVAFANELGDSNSEVLSAAIADDDECLTGSEGCALNALQLMQLDSNSFRLADEPEVDTNKTPQKEEVNDTRKEVNETRDTRRGVLVDANRIGACYEATIDYIERCLTISPVAKAVIQTFKILPGKKCRDLGAADKIRVPDTFYGDDNHVNFYGPSDLYFSRKILPEIISDAAASEAIKDHGATWRKEHPECA